MKEVAIFLVLVLLLSGCGNTKTVQTGLGGTWQAEMFGGSGNVSDPSFVTQFTVNGDVVNISSFQFLTLEPCFPISGGIVNGTDNITVNSNDTVTGTITFVVQSNGNTLTVNGNVTGTATVTSQNGSQTLNGASISGTWTLAGSGTGGCNSTGGNFTMSQTSTT